MTATEPLMEVEVRVSLTDSPRKLVELPATDGAVPMGMHGELAAFYGAESVTPEASTLDYVIGALSACLASTFKRALVARGVTIEPEQLSTEATGRIVVRGQVPVIESVEVRYRLRRIDPADLEKVERAHAVHHRGCAVSRSLEGSFESSTSLQIVDDAAGGGA